MSKRVLFAASEIYPFAKTGGLADVAYALPRALKEAHTMDVIIPLYRSIDREKYSIAPIGEYFLITMGNKSYEIELYGCQYEGMEYRFVYSPILCDREFLYGTASAGYEDNAIRFGIFAHAITALAKKDGYDLLHLNDWQCALAALLVHQNPTLYVKTLYTIHNLAYQGVFDSSVMGELGIDGSYFHIEGMEFYNQISFMKAGIAFSDIVTTVSPTYAKEILTPEFGCGLEGFLRHHKNKLIGVINGIDKDHFSPKNDPALVSPYHDAKGKKGSKSALLKTLGLKGSTKPLFIFVGRFVAQKGMELLIEALPKIAAMECNIAILGEGEEHYNRALQSLAQDFSNIHLTFGYDEGFAHRLYASGDFLLMPSLFEPCGLNQMIAFVYGTIPVVHATGGLADSVKKIENFSPNSSDGYGVVFNSPSSRALLMAIKKGYELYSDKKHLEKIINHNMGVDFSWTASAQIYSGLYETLTKEKV